MPKGFLRRKFINVYEVPDKYGIEEEEYMKALFSPEYMMVIIFFLIT